jgi:hypothetical protein
LLKDVAYALAYRGADVIVDAAGDNLVRTDPATGRVVVCAQGLPNLLHELVHVVLAGVLDDDHGIDYGAIPFDLETVAGRRVLWEELACCVLSCAWLADADPGASPDDVRRQVDDWFREQVDIQPVFYGMEEDPPGFWRRVDALRARHADEVNACLVQAYRDTEALLVASGAPRDRARPHWRPSLDERWGRAGRRSVA